MGIARDELVKGMYLYERSHLSNGAGGAATQMHRRRGKVLDWNRGAAEVEFEDGRRKLVPFNLLEPDDDWLAEHRKKQDEKRARIAKERELSLVEPAKSTLSYTLAEKLAVDDEEEAEEPAEETVAQRRQREEARLAIAALGTPPSPPVPPKEEPPKRSYVILDEAQRIELARAVVAGELTQREASEMYGVSLGTVVNIVGAHRAGPGTRPPPLGTGTGRTAEERAELVKKVDALLVAPHFLGVSRACLQAGIATSSYQRWKSDLQRDAQRAKRKVHSSEVLQKAIGKALTEGRLTTRAAEERFGMRMTTAQKYARDYAAGAYKHVPDVPLDGEEPAPVPPPAPEPPPPEPAPAPEPPPPPPPPPPPVFTAPPPDSGAQVVIAQLTSENRALKDENARLRSKIKQLLPLVFDVDG
jgi:transposase